MGGFRLEAELFTANGDTAAYIIWQNLLAIANVGMIIVLLVIIFSQVTGHGIDNYGIKKMLPKLITVAILINLSYFLCQVAVDLSNIIGRGLVELSKTINAQVSGGNYAEVGFGVIFTTLFGSGAAIAALSPAIISALSVSGPLWVVPFILVALAGLISFIVFFLLLATRQLLAVILVAVSPVAILCYALPNTQKIFNKWVDLFKVVLLVYPICGGLYGMSKLMKAIAFTAPGIHIWMIMVALLMTFVPLVAAPAILKQALAMFNHFGTMIAGMGEKMKGGLKASEGVLRGTEAWKGAERTKMVNRAQANIKAGKAVSNGTANRRQRFRAWASQSGTTRGLARNQALVERAHAEDVDSMKLSMRDETGNYDVNIMGEQLSGLLDKADQNGGLSADDSLKVDALTSQLSGMAGGAKQISQASAGRTGASAQIMGESMAKNNAVKNAVDSKSRRTSSRLADIASGAISANTSQAQYDNMNNDYLNYRRKEAAKAKAEGRAASFENDEARWLANNQHSNTSVVQNIAQNVLDKDKDFVTQSTSEVQELLKHVSDDRVIKMYDNRQLYSMGDVAEGAELAVRGELDRRTRPTA